MSTLAGQPVAVEASTTQEFRRENNSCENRLPELNRLPEVNRLPPALPRLTALGQELDTSPEAFGELESSLAIIDDGAALRAKMQEDGYLFLPGYLHREEVLAARDEVAARLQAEGALDPAFAPERLILREGAEIGFRADLTHDNAPLLRVLYSGPMMELFRRFFGGEVLHFDYTWFRAMPPGRSTPPHMDVVYMGRGTHDLLTAWTPVSDIPLDVGGLMILEKSHRHERINNNYGQRDVDQFCANKESSVRGERKRVTSHGWLSKNPVKLRENLGGRWLTAQYRAGDLLVFTVKTIHASIENASSQIRLSSDSRYQRKGEAVDERWIGEKPTAHGPESKRGMIC